MVHNEANQREKAIDTLIRICKLTALATAGILLSACVIQELNQDMNELEENYGFFKGQVSGSAGEADVVIALVNVQTGEVASVRTVSYGEPVYALLPRGNYYSVAFEDKNGDFAYQRGEAAAYINDPIVSWFANLEIDDRIDIPNLPVQVIELSTQTVLPGPLDLSLKALRSETKSAENFLRIVTWEEPNFSAENIELGMWQPQAFIKKLGFGLYVLDEFDPEKKHIVAVHGISDSPRVFRELADAIPDEYQLLMFHYPSSSSLEYTSYILSEAMDEVVQRYDIEQIDLLAHSMGGLVSKGLIYQASPDVRERMRLFISIASPFGGHAAASQGVKWAPVVAPVWWAMAPGSHYLETIDSLDLSSGPKHHLFYTYSHERGGARQEDDTVVSVESQLIESAESNATAIYPMADSHVGVMTNDCTLRMVPAILEDGSTAVSIPGC
jgi:pimeloyl-ACP methyl ester carboxylesterase